MTLTNEIRDRIDKMTYTEMLGLWRFAPAGDTMFQGESGDYFAQRMQDLRESEDVDHVGASKAIGWEQ